MNNRNEDVANGIANGTTCTFMHAQLKLQLKADVDLQPIRMHGYWVNAVSTNDVEYLELEWQDSSQFKGKFRVFPVSGVFKVRIPIVEMGTNLRIAPNIQMTQFPVVINHATTGHKLQGKSMDALVIAEWSKVKNWAYVVLSRVRSLPGLFLTNPIPLDIDFEPAGDYLDMMSNLRTTVLALPGDVATLKGTYTEDR